MQLHSPITKYTGSSVRLLLSSYDTELFMRPRCGAPGPGDKQGLSLAPLIDPRAPELPSQRAGPREGHLSGMFLLGEWGWRRGLWLGCSSWNSIRVGPQ